MVAIPGANITPIVNGSGSTLQTPSGDWSLLRHAIMPRKLGGGVACWMTSNSSVSEGGSYRVVITFCFLVLGVQTNPSPQLQGLSLGHLDGEGICPATTMGQDGCNTFSKPGNLFGGLFSAEGSLAVPMVASSSGVLAGVDLMLWGLASSVGMADISSGRAMPLNTSSLEKER